MSEYVLVCLIGDEPTRLAGGFAEWMHTRRQAVALLTNPTPNEVAQLLKPSRTLVILGHNSALNSVHSMRSERDGGVWLRGDELGQFFTGVRQYLWACETMGSGSARTGALADDARRAGAARVAGHAVTLSADFDQLGGRHAEAFRQSLARLVWGFVDGEDDVLRLRLRAREALPFDLELDASRMNEDDLDWFRRKDWLDDRIANFHVA